MNESELLGKSRQFKSQAEILLKKNELLTILSKYGRIEITGAYAYDLMLCGDIDIHVIVTEFNREMALRAFNEIAVRLTDFYGMKFNDFIHAEKGYLIVPEGYCINLNKMINNIKWKIDIWFLSVEKSNIEFNKFMYNHLNDENRRIILLLKHLRDKNGLKLESYKIYEAVLKRGVKTFEELINATKPQVHD